LNFTDTLSLPLLLPGDSAQVTHDSSISDNLINRCTVVASPVHDDGSALLEDDVSHSDLSEVERLASNPKVSITSRVYIGDEDDLACSTAVEQVSGIFFTDVVYCFNVTNEGDTYLDDLLVWDDDLGVSKKIDQPLAPSASFVFTKPSKIVADVVNEVSVTGRPTLNDGEEILGSKPVTDSDTSTVSKLTFSANISIKNKVVLGSDASKCKGAVDDSVSATFGSPVVYCFIVTNEGESHLSSVRIADKALVYFETLEGTLSPSESRITAFKTVVGGSMQNTAVAVGVS